MTQGNILNIQRFCTDDGPGIRTTVFLKGCPLRCAWCHNPESQSVHFEIMFDVGKCVRCGRCVEVCPKGCHLVVEGRIFDRHACIGCGVCAKECPTNALKLYGKHISVEEAYREIEKDEIFYETSGGGVTVSGGEPLFQPEFVTDLLRTCKENGIHTAIETSGLADESILLSVIKYCDLILFDIKETDEELHKRYTGVSLKPIFRNLSTINEKEIPFIIRAPIIPSVNDRDSHFKALKEVAVALKACQGVQIMPYHKTGSYKYKLLDREYGCNDIIEPKKDMTESWNRLFRNQA